MGSSQALAADVLTDEEKVVHIRKHERAPRTLCGLTISEANNWPRGNIWIFRDQLQTANVPGRRCKCC